MHNCVQRSLAREGKQNNQGDLLHGATDDLPRRRAWRLPRLGDFKYVDGAHYQTPQAVLINRTKDESAACILRTREQVVEDVHTFPNQRVVAINQEWITLQRTHIRRSLKLTSLPFTTPEKDGRNFAFDCCRVARQSVRTVSCNTSGFIAPPPHPARVLSPQPHPKKHQAHTRDSRFLYCLSSKLCNSGTKPARLSAEACLHRRLHIVS